MIFSAVSNDFQQPRFTSECLRIPSSMDLSSVCRLRSKSAIGSPLLWYHLELVASGSMSKGYHQCATLWAGCLAIAPVFVDIREGFTTDLETPPAELPEMTTFLTPLAPRICSLEIDDSRNLT
jgi:hypothetical protein